MRPDAITRGTRVLARTSKAKNIGLGFANAPHPHRSQLRSSALADVSWLMRTVNALRTVNGGRGTCEH